VKFKLDENLSPSLAGIFTASGHDAHSITDQHLNGQPDDRVIDVCTREQRALVTLDTDFCNMLTYPPAPNTAGSSSSGWQISLTRRYQQQSSAPWNLSLTRP